MSCSNNQYCTFWLADMFLGLRVDRVQEVMRYQSMTFAPLVSPIIGGLINLRGQIVTAIDLRERMGLPRAADGSPMNVVARAGGEVVSLLVDRIGDVLEVSDESFEPSPPTLHGPCRDVIRGVHKLPDKLLLLLDLDRVLEFDAVVERTACPKS